MALKLRMTWNTVRRQTAVLVMTILGLLYGLSIMTSLAFAAVAGVLWGGPDGVLLVSTLCVLIGTGLVIGWLLAPFLFASVDNTLDPRSLATIVPPSRRLAIGLVAATGVGLPGLFSTLAALIPALVWAIADDWAAAGASVVGAALALATCFALSRAVSTWFATRLDGNSKRRDLVAVAGTIVFLIVVSPLGFWISTAQENFSPTVLSRAADIAGWTPFGAAWALAPALHDGRPLEAALHLLIAAATLLAVMLVWYRVLPGAMSGRARHVSAAAEAAIREGRHLVDPTKEESSAQRRTEEAARDGRFLARVEWWQRLGLATPTASLAARTARDWVRDARLSASLAMMVIFPVLAVMQQRMAGDGMMWFFLLFPATLMGLQIGLLQAYDSTALWITVASGISGRRERLGRLVGSLPIMLPLLVLPVLAVGLFVGVSTPALIGMVTLVVTLFATSTGLATVVCARWVTPVQPPGTSPLSTKGTGQWGLTMIVQFGVLIGGAILAAPVIVAVCLSLWFDLLPMLVAALAGLVWSLLALVVGVLVGGRVWEASRIEVLTTIRSWPGH